MDLEGRAIQALGAYLSVDEFPLASFLPSSTLHPTFDALFLVDPVITTLPGGLQFDTGLAWEGELALQLPTSDLVTVVLSPGGAGFTAVSCRLVTGTDFQLTVDQLTVAVRISPAVLADAATGGPAEIRFDAALSFTPDGLEVLGPVSVDLPSSEVAGTGLVVQATGVGLVTGSSPRPGYVANPAFEGLVIEQGTLTVPAGWFTGPDGAPVSVTLAEAAIGSTGFTASLAVSRGEPGAPDDARIGLFPARFQSLVLAFVDSAIEQAELALDLRLPALETGAGTGDWVRLAATIGSDGSFSASLAAVQPDGAGGGAHLVNLDLADAVTLSLDSLRLDHAGERWTAWIDGAVTVAIGQLIGAGGTWPELAFSQIGVSDDGTIELGDDAGISLQAPVTVDFDLATLSLSTLRLGAGSSPGSLAVGVNGAIEMLKGLPAGASVRGLTVELPAGGGRPAVGLDGIGIGWSVPGGFSASLEAAYVADAQSGRFEGTGQLAVPALDVDVTVSLLVGRVRAGGFTTFQVFADARLMPSGIPIANTGVALYGLQGLVARNRAPAWDLALPADERYYRLFAAPPIGISDPGKWADAEGQSAVGLGLVVGTLDRGFLFSTKGLMVVTFPDVTVLLQSRTDLVSVAPALGDATEGTISSLLVYASADHALSFDLDASIEIPVIVSMTGNATAFFDFDDPGAWYVELGVDQSGQRLTANVLGWQGTWLFTAGAWFRIDATALEGGARLDVDLTASKSGFWIGASGYASADMHLAWNPLQWEGRAAYGLTVGAGYRSASLSFQVEGGATVTVPAPTSLDLTIEACISLLVTQLCQPFRFHWDLPVAPAVTSPEGPRFAAPRHYQVHPDPADDQRLIDGVVELGGPDTAVPVAELNSVVTIDFDRPMVDSVGFNEGIELPDGGQRTIGTESGWSAASELVALTLVQDPDGGAEPVALWGTWALDTPEQNTRLRLFSSERFDHDGSLTSGFATSYTVDYCYEAPVTRTCLSLRDLHLGWQYLVNAGGDATGTVAAWDGGPTNPDTRFGVLLADLSALTLYLPDRPATVTVLLLERTASGGPGRPVTERARPQDGVLVLDGAFAQDRYLTEVCYPRGHGTYQRSATERAGVIVTDQEAWSVPAEELLLAPDTVYELTTTTRTIRRSPSGRTDVPLGDVVTVSRFRTAGPPAFPGAAGVLVAEVVPAHGDRAVFRGYDLTVRLVDRYVPYLWTSVGAELRVRLVDGAGRPVLDADGNEALATVSAEGAVEHTVTTLAWDQLVEAYRGGPCLTIEPPPLPATAETVQYLGGTDLAGLIAPNTRYEAQLVSSADPATPLWRWTFTTGRYATFTDLATTGREIRPARPAPADLVPTGSFDADARMLGLPTIAYVEHLTVTPVLNRTGRRIQAWLLESPEPLEPGVRLAVTVAGRPAQLTGNGDGTRVLVVPAATGRLDDTRISLTWARDPAGWPACTVDGVGGPELVTFTVTAGALTEGEGSA